MNSDISLEIAIFLWLYWKEATGASTVLSMIFYVYDTKPTPEPNCILWRFSISAFSSGKMHWRLFAFRANPVRYWIYDTSQRCVPFPITPTDSDVHFFVIKRFPIEACVGFVLHQSHWLNAFTLHSPFDLVFWRQNENIKCILNVMQEIQNMLHIKSAIFMENRSACRHYVENSNK